MAPTAPRAAKPSKHIFDAFNSSATGHQRADNRLAGSTSWRESRSLKLREQFAAGSGGGKRVGDTVGRGSLDFGLDGRTANGGWKKGAKGLRRGGQQSLWESMQIGKDVEERPAKRVKTQENDKPTAVVTSSTPFREQDGSIRETSSKSHETSPSDLLEPIDPIATPEQPSPLNSRKDDATALKEEQELSQIFANCTFHINGSTAPYSDHKIKHMLSTHGGHLSISLTRRTVTHVIVGKPSSSGGGGGGGLAGSKLQTEITVLRGGSVKFITADWVIESVEAGKRLPESRFEALKIAAKGVASIKTMFEPKAKAGTS